MKRIILLIFGITISVILTAQSVTITETGGWFETAWVEWSEPSATVDRYNVYYTGGDETDVLIDDQLIRDYGDYWRADIPGLAAGTYTITIIPEIDGSEADAATTGSITVIAHDRTGFAFSDDVVPGAYKADGTPKDNAVIIYITENTKDSVSLDITGASSNPCVGFQTILDGIKKGDDTRPFIFRMVGEITDMSYMLNGDIVIEDDNNTSCYVTLEGIGEDATANGWGIRIKNANNIEIRNIGIMNCNSDEGDDIGLQQSNEYIWVHNCDFFYGDAGSDSDQAKGDGALDCKKSTYVTFSFNHFWDSGKCNLLGLSEGTTEGLYITYHHNWYDHSDSRHPRVRYYSAHIYNNYYDGNAKYGAGSTLGSSLFVEGNYFRNCKYPMLTSMQGSDIAETWTSSSLVTDADNLATFSSEDGGTIKAYNNYMEGQERFVAYGDDDYYNSTTHFDAYVVSSRDDEVPSSVTSVEGANTHNNFDTDASVMYDYTAEEPADAQTTVTEYAGRINGGDFEFTFDNDVDDESYAVNTELKSALTSYATELIYIQGDGDAPVIAPVVEITDPETGTEYDLGETITITATATDSDGSISNVTFYVSLDGTETEIGSDDASTFEASWTPTVAGTYNVYAVATDNEDNTGTSDTDFTIIIDDPNVNDAPSMISVSTTSSTFVEGADVVVTADASDDNAVASVAFYNGTTLLTTVTSEPYTYTMSSAAIGTYTITAIVYDEEGLSDDGSCTFEVVELDESEMTHNFTESGLSSTFYTITGNLSDSKGTETYNGLTLTQCLKIESSTSITFTLVAEADLVLVFNMDSDNGTFTGGININDVEYTATDGIITVTLAAGTYTITKVDSGNLYYMSASYTGEDTTTYTLTVTQATGGTITPTTATYDEGTTVTVTATAEDGYVFSNWTGDLADVTDNPTTITMDADKTISAVFTEEESLSVSLTAGWNIVGCTIDGTTDIETAFSSIWDYIISIKDADNYYLSTNPTFLNTLDSVIWGKGYLVKVSEDCVLTW